MPSKYRPQLFGWIGDLDKVSNYLSSADDRLIYANDNYCVFIRKTLWNRLFYVILSGMLIAGMFWCLVLSIHLSISFFNEPDSIGMFINTMIGTVTLIIGLYVVIIPEFYQNLFSSRGSPIIFNRKTQKVYVNESYFFNFKFWRNPLLFLLPAKRRVKEYDWNDLQGIMVHNYSRYALSTTILMVCKPGTNQTIDHIMLDPARSGVGSTFVWGWVNNFMSYFHLISLNEGKYLSAEEAEFKKAYIQGQRWPKWMVEAFNAESLAQLAEIKAQYKIKN